MLKTIVSLTVLSGALAAQSQMPELSCELVPGWTKDGPARAYTADNLYEYMDGNSEGYFRYHFREMLGITCRKGESTFVLDVSDMEDSEHAYGLFSSNRDLRQPQIGVGMGGQIVPRRLIFAKGKFYVEIAANPEGDYTNGLKVWAAALEKAVPGTSEIPAEPAWFRQDKLESLRMVPESVLGIRALKAGYVAEYDFGKAFLVREVSPAAAAAVLQDLKIRFRGANAAKVADDAFLATDQYLGRLCIFRNGKYVGGYSIASPKIDALPLAVDLAAKIK